MKFDELKLDTEILAGVASVGFEECTEVQERAIPYLLDRKDIMVQSQTGTGKTAAFLLPAFHLLRNDPDFSDGTVLIVAPTRELAVQIKEESDMLADGFDIKTEVFHGGVGYGQQEKALNEGVRIMVGTPGRILDLSQTGKMPLKQVKMMIIDEADRLFDMGFYPDIRKMMRRMRPREERLNMLFSATLSTRVRNIAWEYMNEPVEIEVQPEQITVDKVKQTLYHVSSEEKLKVMLGLLKERKPKNAIVFTNTKRAAEEVAKRLEINGYPSEFIIGDLPQRKRLAIIRKIKAGEAEYLVATDVAARGLHINNLEMVINYDLPEDPEAYVHRIGRTARAGESGEAIALACEHYVFGLEAIEKLINQKIPVGDLTNDLFGEDASEGMRIRTDSGRDGGRSGGRDGGRGGRNGARDSRDGGRGSRDGSRGSRRSGGDRERTRDGDTGGRRPARSGGAPPKRRSDQRRPDQRRPDYKRSERRNDAVPTGAAPKASDSLEERLAYYRKKYGEDFQPTDEMLKNMQAEAAASGGSKSRGPQSSSNKRSRSKSQRNRRPLNRTEESSKSDRPKTDEKRNDNGKRGDGTRDRNESPTDTPRAQRFSETQKPAGKPKKGIIGRIKSFFG